MFEVYSIHGFIVRWLVFFVFDVVRNVSWRWCLYDDISKKSVVLFLNQQGWSSWLWRGFNTAEVLGSIPSLCSINLGHNGVEISPQVCVPEDARVHMSHITKGALLWSPGLVTMSTMYIARRNHSQMSKYVKGNLDWKQAGEGLNCTWAHMIILKTITNKQYTWPLKRTSTYHTYK